jgi:hypothetical protein
MNQEDSDMENANVTEQDRAWARICLACPCGKSARSQQKGLAYDFVKNVSSGLCPFCLAYEKVYGRKAHEPASVQ